jgi:hypothetical protein
MKFFSTPFLLCQLSLSSIMVNKEHKEISTVLMMGTKMVPETLVILTN